MDNPQDNNNNNNNNNNNLKKRKREQFNYYGIRAEVKIAPGYPKVQ
jgi:hypothetical protein